MFSILCRHSGESRNPSASRRAFGYMDSGFRRNDGVFKCLVNP
jgi:hypothetical protein